MTVTSLHIGLRTALIGAALALALLAWPAAASAAFLNPEGSFSAAEGTFGDLRGIATDDAGRVYVADATRGRIEVYDNARNGNAFLRSIGERELVSPTGVAVDNRSRIYVSDAGRSAVVQFESLADDAVRRRTFTFPAAGPEGGGGAPRGLDVDLSAQVYVADRATGRVQVLQIKGRDLVGLSEVASSLGEIEGVTRDTKGRIYVSSDNEESGEVRAIDEKGQVLRVVAPAGGREEIEGDKDEEKFEPAAGGTVNSPKQLARDRLDRIVVADAGNDRVQVFAGYDQGNALLASFGVSGAGGGQLQDPSGVATAPGALLYVADAGNQRIVRLRMDDENGDGIFDASPAAAPTGPSGCTGPSRGQRDANGDGCADPVSRITAPLARTYRAGDAPTIVAGRASADALGVSRVEVSLAIRRGGSCLYYARGRFSRRGSCAQPRYFAVSGRERWLTRVRLSRPGTYEVRSRATQQGGLVESAQTSENRRSFRISRQRAAPERSRAAGPRSR
ncbi:MAG: hypothetical protein H0X55_04605 [Thermoleophilaceae bacterium]|nr:hypothetical protein [Thermoleophilaceae bacterium]